MTAMVRVNSLTLGGAGNKTLHSMEEHGKRNDKSSKKRRIRDVEPLVYGSLDLRAAYDAHVHGARMNAGLKRPVLHAIIKFPGDLDITPELEKMMLDLSVKFINQTHGGDAVFAARLDRDELGQHVVDVFYAPKFQKQTTIRKNDLDAGLRRGDTVSETWVSTTKHGKDLCEKYRDEIESRNDQRKFTTGPRQVGIALQSELHEFLTIEGFDLKPRNRKAGGSPDRVETEAYKALRDAERAEQRALDAVAAVGMASADASQHVAQIMEDAETEVEAMHASAQADVDRIKREARAEAFAEAAQEISGLRAALERIESSIKKLVDWGHKMLPKSLADKLDRKLLPIEAETDFVAAQIDDMSAIEDTIEDGPAFG